MNFFSIKRIFFSFLFSFVSIAYSKAQIHENIDIGVQKKSSFKDWLSNGHILGFRLGTYSASMTSMGMVEQSSLTRLQYGIMFMYGINKNFGVQIEILHTKMGNRNVPLSSPIALPNDPDNPIVGLIEGLDSKPGKKIILTKKEQTITLNYLAIPFTFCFVYKSHPNSNLKNYFTIGPQMNILLTAKKTIYKTPSMLAKKTETQFEWEWAESENCYDCVLSENISDEVPRLDFGLNLGYMLETNIGIIFGIRYYEGFKRIYYKRDMNSFHRQRRNTGIGLYLGYNFMSLFI